MISIAGVKIHKYGLSLSISWPLVQSYYGLLIRASHKRAKPFNLYGEWKTILIKGLHLICSEKKFVSAFPLTYIIKEVRFWHTKINWFITQVRFLDNVLGSPHRNEMFVLWRMWGWGHINCHLEFPRKQCIPRFRDDVHVFHPEQYIILLFKGTLRIWQMQLL